MDNIQQQEEGGGGGKRHSRMDNRLMISLVKLVKNRMNKCELLTVSLLGPNSFRIFSFRGKVWSDLSILARYRWTKDWKTRLHI